ncbi:hypothetical protein [Micromonospora sp. WMMD1082]|uniref:hypothetical protein n=1 Tax=Micromonospora sp. WMMD1082 TaxID=3016104 RepID=UPI002416571E|nr:hypothetical protein [Micromonospora sp. WMMD1082]MDG4795196.1 hypothetical protein [Micromonospora sp. WMMD1082]
MSDREYSFYTWNLKDYLSTDTDTDTYRYAAVVDVIRELGATVIAVQEVTAASQAAAMAQMARLADLTGMTATVSAGGPGEAASDRPVYAGGAGGNRFATGLLWARDTSVRVHPDSFRVYGGSDFFHSLTKVDLTIGGERMTVASGHYCPIGQPRRASEAKRVVSAMPLDGLGLVGSDGNTIGFARVPDGMGGYRFYDDDPYASRPWQPGFVHTCTWTTDERGEIVAHQADREAARILAAGGLHDVAPTIGAEWTPTAGHQPHRCARHRSPHRLHPRHRRNDEAGHPLRGAQHGASPVRQRPHARRRVLGPGPLTAGGTRRCRHRPGARLERTTGHLR